MTQIWVGQIYRKIEPKSSLEVEMTAQWIVFHIRVGMTIGIEGTDSVRKEIKQKLATL